MIVERRMYIKKDEKALNKDYPFEIQRFIATKELNRPNAFHWHSFFEITYVETGKGYYYVNGKSYYMESGDIIIFNHIEPHGWEVIDEDMTMLVATFSSDFISERTSLFDYDYLIPFMERGSNFKNKIGKEEAYTEEIATILKNIDRENQQEDLGFQLMIKADVLRILTILIRHYERKKDARGLLSKKKIEMKRLEEVFTYIKGHYTDKMTLEEIAQVACMSPNYFSFYFKKVTGRTFKEHVVELRLQRAEELLKTTEMSVLEIATACGFSNMSNFYRLYKKHRSLSPGDERTHLLKS